METVYIPCEICRDLVLSNKFDPEGKRITKIQCWNCISNEVEEINTDNFLERVKGIDLRQFKNISETKYNARGIIQKVFDKLKDEFTLDHVYEAYLESKVELKEDVIRDARTRGRVVQNYSRYWIKKRMVNKIGSGQGSIFRKIPVKASLGIN